MVVKEGDISNTQIYLRYDGNPICSSDILIYIIRK
jgi:hypothetical protein